MLRTIKCFKCQDLEHTMRAYIRAIIVKPTIIFLVSKQVVVRWCGQVCSKDHHNTLRPRPHEADFTAKPQRSCTVRPSVHTKPAYPLTETVNF